MAKREIDPKKSSTGSAAKLSRDKKGTLKATYASDFGGITQKTMAQDRKTKAGTGNGQYNGVPAPRVGGKQKMIAQSGSVVGGTKKMMKQSKRRVNKSSASKAAKQSARKLY